MYAQTAGTLQATDGTDIGITIQHVDIDPAVAKEIFERGVQVGDWHWKHQIWACTTLAELRQIQAAARFYYGWSENSEIITKTAVGYTFEAWYSC